MHYFFRAVLSLFNVAPVYSVCQMTGNCANVRRSLRNLATDPEFPRHRRCLMKTNVALLVLFAIALASASPPVFGHHATNIPYAHPKPTPLKGTVTSFV